MKKTLSLLCLIILCIVASTIIISCKSNDVSISFKTLTVNGTNVSGNVSNDTETFSFINEISTKKGTKYTVSADIGGQEDFPSKTINLNVGDNTVYITEFINDEPTNIYTVTIRRAPIHTVTFNANGGTEIESIKVEEGKLIEAPEPSYTGYTFVAWDYDFSNPIMNDITITASWRANTDIPYKVEYYLEGTKTNSYTLDHVENFIGEAGSTATAPQKVYDHFTLNLSKSSLIGTISGNGSLVLKVYYNRNTYTVLANISNTDAGMVSGQGIFSYGTKVTLTAKTNDGYTFLGWFDDQAKISDNSSYSFEATKSVVYTAKWSTNTNTPYTVEYYFENENDSNYTLVEAKTLKGTTNTTAFAEPEELEHFALNSSKSTFSGPIAGNGSLVLKIYYKRVTYKLSNANPDFGSVTSSGTYKYGKSLTATATSKLGYEFIGWYGNNTLLSKDSTYTFIIDSNVEARFILKPEMEIFNFTSTETTCTIKSVKDISITQISIPDCITSIADRVFYECESLINVYISDIAAWCAIDFNSTSSNPLYYAKNLYLNNELITEITIPSSVTAISGFAFYNYSKLTSVSFSKDSNLTYIGQRSFYNCTALTSINLPESTKSIGDYAFYCCSALTSIYIPENTTTIGDYAFSNCISLVSIRIPINTTTISSYAFSNCSELKNVYYGGTSKDWDKIAIWTIISNTSLTNATRYYYSDNPPTTAGNYWHYDENGNIVVW